MEAQLVHEVQKSLDFYLYRQAQFLCERLCAQFPSEANTFLLATCYYRGQEIPRAYNILREFRSQGWTQRTCYLFAQCCFELGRLPEAEGALKESGLAMGPAGYHLLGKICRKSGSRTQDAAMYQEAALRQDPLLWVAFEELCELGEGDKAQHIFEAAAAPVQGTGEGQGLAGPLETPSAALFPELSGRAPTHIRAWNVEHTPASAFNGSVVSSGSPMSLGKNVPGTRSTSWTSPDISCLPPSPVVMSSFVTPSPSATQMEPPAAPRNDRERGREAQRAQRGAGLPPAGNGALPFQPGLQGPEGVPRGPGSRSIPSIRGKFFDDGKLRKVSGRLFNEPAATLRRGSRVAPSEQAAAELCAQDWERNNGSSGPSFSGRLAGEASDAGRQELLALLWSLGTGWRHLCMYRCKEAIEAFQQLPVQQRNTGWVYTQIGRAYYEISAYEMASHAFKQARKFDKFRLEGMEYYSSVLWHLKKEMELAHLAHEVSSVDRKSPSPGWSSETCFSLQKEHEAAIRFFQRALQLDSGAAYAYTLCGHEYFANEDFDSAMKCYQNAERLDPRHYNALYGMGQVYFRQEKWMHATVSFSRALQVNPKSSVLHCYMGVTLSKQDKNLEAMNELNTAIAMDPNNPLAKYERAALLLHLNRTEEALAELHALKELAPREASIWFQMGKIYKKQRRNDEALEHFRTALDLKPSSNDLNLIKSAIEKLNLTDDEQDEDL
eukprot:jgi/Botrbrau1/18155/Bobra.53_1s0025.1